MPEGNQFMTLSEHDAANFRYGPYLGIARSDDLVFPDHRIQHSHSGTEESLFRRVAELLCESPGIRPEDVFVNLVEAARGELVPRPWPRAMLGYERVRLGWNLGNLVPFLSILTDQTYRDQVAACACETFR